MNRTARAAALLSAALAAGCYTYVPLDIATVPPGEDVRVHLSRAGQIELSALAPRIDETVAGTVVRRDGEAVLLTIPVSARQEGFFRSDIEQELAVSTTHIVGIDRRQFSASKTGLFIGATAGAAGLIIATIISATSDPSGPGGGGIDELRIPLFTLPTR